MAKKIINMPIPRIEVLKTNEQVFKRALLSKIPKLQSKIIANRDIPSYIKPIDIFKPSLKGLDVYKLKDIKKAADRVADAVINKEVIALLCDFDVDGISSAAVLESAFINYFNYNPTLIKQLVSNRMKAGYGFSANVLDRLMELNPLPTLVITADQGSKDDIRVSSYMELMKEKGIENADVIVTDHHHIDGSGPSDAYAVVNPQRYDCDFEDKTICGCTVALLLMVAVRDSLIEKNHLPPTTPKLTDLLTFSTAATIADCVSMASPFNRAIVNRGLADMNAGTKAPWRAMRSLFSDESQTLRTDSIGFGLGPRINACSRTGGDGLVALKFYLSETEMEAHRYLSMLDFQNEDRKKIEKKLLVSAMSFASQYYTEGKNSLVIFLEDGHHGVHGIVASRIVEKYGRPVICISPKEFEEEVTEVVEIVKGISKKKKIKTKNITTVSGSARSIDGIDIHECLENAARKNPDLFMGFGGHPMAAGMSLKYEKIELLRYAIEDEVTKMLTFKPHPVLFVDGELKANTIIDLNFVDELLKLEPFGNNFDYPRFKIIGEISSVTLKGKNKDTGFFDIIFGGYMYNQSIWFKYDQSPMFNKLHAGYVCEFVIAIREKFWRGVRSVQIQIEHANPINQ
jgi:single-stranded-DNA-specific exonuclease